MSSLSGTQLFCVLIVALLVLGSVGVAFANRNKPEPRDPKDPPL